MNTLRRYVLKSHVAPALAGLALFYFVLSMDFIVDYLNLFIAKGVPGMAVLEAFLLSLAWMTLLAVPMAVMVAVLTVFGRLSGDNEITAAKANGVNVFSLILPVLIAAAITSVGVFWFGDRFLPNANLRLKTLLVDIHRISPLATIEPGVLTELPGGYSIIVEGLDSRTSQIEDVRIHRIERGQPLQTIIARRGSIAYRQAGSILSIELFDGEIHELDAEDPTRFNRLLFDRHAINIEQGAAELVRSGETKRGERELSIRELELEMADRAEERAVTRRELIDRLDGDLTAVLSMADGTDPLDSPAGLQSRRASTLRAAESSVRSLDGSRQKSRKLEVEYHKKFSIPFSCVVFVLLGAPLGIRTKRGGVGIGAGIGILFFLIYYLFLIGGEQLGDRGIVSPFWAMWAPNVFFGAIGLFLTLATCREWRLASLSRVLDFVLRVPAKIDERENA
jgi:lipopolysaccharide export system permease protein